MNRNILLWIASISTLGMLSALAWGELRVQTTDQWLTHAALSDIRAKAPGAKIRLVSSSIERVGDRGRITLKIKLDRRIDSVSGDRQIINRVTEEPFRTCGIGVIKRKSPVQPPVIKPTGTQELTLYRDYLTEMIAVPQMPFLGNIKARTELVRHNFYDSIGQDEFVDQLYALVIKGDLDNALHDRDRVLLENYNPSYSRKFGQRTYVPRSAHEKPSLREIQFLESMVVIEAHRRDWTQAIYALERLRREGRSTTEGRMAIRRGEEAVIKLYDSLSRVEKQLLKPSSHEAPPIKPGLTKF